VARQTRKGGKLPHETQKAGNRFTASAKSRELSHSKRKKLGDAHSKREKARIDQCHDGGNSDPSQDEILCRENAPHTGSLLPVLSKQSILVLFTKFFEKHYLERIC
jgi:hypothetical protein